MLEQHIIELINADIDGELGLDGRKELSSILESSPEAAVFHKELIELNDMFRNAPVLESPPALAGSILASIQLPVRRGFFDFFQFLGGSKPATAGLAFAAGLLVAVGLYETESSRGASDQDTVKMVGTMVGDGKFKAAGQEIQLSLDLDELNGKVTLFRGESGDMLEFELDSKGEVVEIEIDFEKAGLLVSGFAQHGGAKASLIETLKLSGGNMRLVNQGRHHFVIFLRQQPGTKEPGKDIRIGISRDGERVYESTRDSWR